MLSLLIFSLQITMPIAILVVLGIWFRRLGWIDEAFNTSASKLVFNVALPALLFVNITSADSSSALSWQIICFGALFTVVAYFALSIMSQYITAFREERGVFVQGAFRGNMGIIGLAFCLSTFGAEGATLAAIYLAVISLVYNVLAVVTLNRWSTEPREGNVIVESLMGFAKNPLIVTIAVAGIWLLSGIEVPVFINKSGQYLAQLTLPLALLSIGASLSWAGMVAVGKVTAYATFMKLVVIPYLAAAIGYLFGFRGMELGVMYLMMASPTAAASYMMVRAIGGNVSLAASIVAVTTVLSLVTTSIGLVAMKAWGWI